MTTINLRDYYPSLYSKDEYIDVPDEVAKLLKDSENEQKAYEYYKLLTNKGNAYATKKVYEYEYHKEFRFDKMNLGEL